MDYLAEGALPSPYAPVSFLHCQVTPPPPIPMYSLEGSQYVYPLPWGEGLCSRSLRAENLHTLFGILLHGRCVSSLPFMHSSSHLFVSVWTHGFFFILSVTMQYHFILLFKLSHLWPLGALPAGSCVLLTYPDHCEGYLLIFLRTSFQPLKAYFTCFLLQS